MLFCSEFARRQGEDPIGTAPYSQHHIMVEVPLPWPGEAFTAPAVPSGLADIFRRVRATGITLRTNAIAPDPEYSRPGWTRVFYFRQPDTPLRAYSKQEYLVPTELTTDLVATLLKPAMAPDHQAGISQGADAFRQYRRETDHIRDLLICTHDERDACCGRFGAALYEALRREVVPPPAETGARPGQLVRVWRVSHMGGHRLAPTLMDMPEGRYWGHLTPDAARQLVQRTGPVHNLRRHYRGWALLDDPLLQVAEREAFIHYGWSWLQRAVTGTRRDEGSGHGATATIEFNGPHPGGQGTLRVAVAELPPVPTITCSDPQPKGRARQFLVTQVQVEEHQAGDLSAPAG